MMHKGHILIVSGCAGSGKGTILTDFRKKCDRVYYSVSCTTRPMRPGEIDGVHYYFKTREEFETMLANGEFAEHTEYCGNYYGTPIHPLLDAVKNGKIAILEIETEGALNIMAKFPEHLSVFIAPPDGKTLEHRLRSRGTEDEPVIQKRMETARLEIPLATRYQHVLINHDDRASDVADTILAICNGESFGESDVFVRDIDNFISHYFD